MLNIGVGSILTNGLGGPAYNLLTFGPFNLYIAPFDSTPTPTPEPTPTVTPTPSLPPDVDVNGGAGGAGYDDEPRHYKLTLKVNLTKRKSVTRTFIVDKNQQEVIIRRVGKINSVRLEFKVFFRKIKRVFTLKWKK